VTVRGNVLDDKARLTFDRARLGLGCEGVPFSKNIRGTFRLWDDSLVFGRRFSVEELEVFARELVVGIES
jgi:hypothetical protein